MAIRATPRGPYFKKFAFIIEFDGIQKAAFQSVGPLQYQVAEVTQWQGGALIPQKDPGRITVPDLVLTRGATGDSLFYGWAAQVIQEAFMPGDEESYRKNFDIVQINRKGTELIRWTVYGAWVKDSKTGEWDNNTDENVIEEVTLAYDYYTVGGSTGV